MSIEEADRAIRESCLVPFLESELSQASFTDMGNRLPSAAPAYYSLPQFWWSRRM